MLYWVQHPYPNRQTERHTPYETFSQLFVYLHHDPAPFLGNSSSMGQEYGFQTRISLSPTKKVW